LRMLAQSLRETRVQMANRPMLAQAMAHTAAGGVGRRGGSVGRQAGRRAGRAGRNGKCAVRSCRMAELAGWCCSACRAAES